MNLKQPFNVSNLRHIMKPPIFSGDEEKSRVAHVLNAAIWITFNIALLFSVFLLIFSSENQFLLFYSIPVLLLNLFGLNMLHRGYVRATALFIIFGALLLTFGSSVVFGGVTEANLMGYVAIIIFSGLVLGRRGLLAVSMLAMLAWGISLFFDITDVFTSEVAFSTSNGMAINTLVFIFIIGLIYIVVHNQERALNQAQTNAQVLGETIGALRATTISRSYLDNIIKSMGDMLVVVGPSGAIELVNRATLQILGYTEDELIGQSVEFIFADAYRDRTGVATVVKQGVSQHVEKAFRAKDGRSIPVSFSGRLMRDEPNEMRVVCIAQDITPLKAAAEAIQRERDFAVQIMNALGQGVSVTDKERRFEYVNPAFAQMLGYRSEELIGKRPHDLVVEEHQYVLDEASQERKDGKPSTYEVSFKRVDGSLVHVLVTGVPRWQDSEVIGAIAVTTDLAEANRIELTLRESEARNRALLNAIPDIMLLQNREGVYLDYHAGVGQTLYGDPTQLLGKNMRDLLPAPIADQLTVAFEQAFTTNQPQVVEYAYQPPDSPDNQPAFFEARVVTYDDDRVLTIVRDITNRRLSEQQSFDLARERERTRLLADFIQDVSHDFRTPLSIINTSLYLLKRHEDPERRAHHIAVLETQAAHIIRLMDGMIVMMRLDNEALFNFYPMDLNALIHMAQGSWLSLAEKKSITLLVDQEEELLQLKLDVDELSRALTNLVENAVQFTPPGGHITIRTYREDTHGIVQVRDSGVGISPESLPQIFDRFYRGDPARSAETGGVGLGLSISKKIIEMHGGTITVESKVGEGTTFKVALPLKREAIAH